MNQTRPLDVERVICRLSDISDPGSRGFTIGTGDWPLRGFVIRTGEQVWGYVNRCPHAGHPLNLAPHKFLTPGRELILCSSHGALFEPEQGLCIAGPCRGARLRQLPLRLTAGYVLLADDVPLVEPADLPRTNGGN
jgi:nitrite reductase/ring-hydroxylating ferredoxin subunit